MAKNKTVHVISHSHWDREWYLPYEKHHVRLVKLMDELLELLENDPEFRSFHLDGQTIILEDYLQVRPEKADKLKQLVQEGRLHIGPWYVLQDEFLTSSEANIRNLLTGMKQAKAYGAVSMLGYFPDSFGNMGQAAQILRQAGIECAVFGRGVKAVGFNNSVEDAKGSFESPYSEMIWEAPDGSKVLGILFANWYHNGMEIPVDREAARVYWEKRIAAVDRFASTPHLLFMNGCDHQPVQANLSNALRTAREVYPDIEFVHSNFDDYVRQVKENVPRKLAVVSGELRSQRTDGWTTLVNTASSRVYIKQANQRCQALLEKAAEPLAAFAATLGVSYPHHLLSYAWKTLMQNHPHDSICGCSVDEVHREMITRFDKSRQVAEETIKDSLKTIVSRIDSSGFSGFFEDAIPFSVFNTTGWARTGVVSVELDVVRTRFDGRNPGEVFAELQQYSLGKGTLIDREGNRIPFEMEDLGVQFSYDLPDDRFRQRYMARRVRLTFEAVQVPSLGYQTFAWSAGSVQIQHDAERKIKVGEREMENEWIKVAIAGNGSLTMTDKSTGRSYSDLCIYEDAGDIGNEYIFRQPDGEEALTTAGLLAQISLVEHSSARAVYEVVHKWELPSRADDEHFAEIDRMEHVRKRTGMRVQEKVPFTITSRITLEASARCLKIETSFDNRAQDHRLRVLIPTYLPVESHFADSIFEIAERQNVPATEWTNPNNCQHQQCFVNVSSTGAGLTVANLGLNEYEILRDGRNTIAVTLLRSVAELGDWGVFPTPEAQCLGKHTVQFSIIPHAGSGMESSAYAEAYQFQVPWFVCQTGIHGGVLPEEHSFMQWSGPSLALSAVKINENTNDLIVRWFNMAGKQASLTVKPPEQVKQVYTSGVLEERLDAVPFAHQEIHADIDPYQIVTMAMPFEAGEGKQ